MFRSLLSKRNVGTQQTKASLTYLLDKAQKPHDYNSTKERSKLIKDGILISETIKSYGCDVDLENVTSGPRLNVFQFKPKVGQEVKDNIVLAKHIGQALDSNTVRVITEDKNNTRIQVEVARLKPHFVTLRELVETPEYENSKAILPVPLGQNTSGEPVIDDLAKMPHLLISGQTGSGKSCMINTILLSLTAKYGSEDLKLILIDPKQVELGIYADIPHLLTPVITHPDNWLKAQDWLLREMERRFVVLAQAKTRNIEEHNETQTERMPYIVTAIDEFADMMMLNGKRTEKFVVSLAQKARAVGIHIIIATSRPSVDVLTGLIKANIPTRIGLTTASKVDSRTIIDQEGAEQLFGAGDLLYSHYSMPKPERLQGAYVSSDEAIRIADSLRASGKPTYVI